MILNVRHHQLPSSPSFYSSSHKVSFSDYLLKSVLLRIISLTIFHGRCSSALQKLTMQHFMPDRRQEALAILATESVLSMELL